jgi:hypothetical protein
MLYYILFFFVALGAKLLLALATIYLLFPTERGCVGCDHDTLLVRPEMIGRMLERVSRGRLQWRWCPHCRWEGWTRVLPAARAAVSSPASRKSTLRP